jgi:hypothetical protein
LGKAPCECNLLVIPFLPIASTVGANFKKRLPSVLPMLLTRKAAGNYPGWLGGERSGAVTPRAAQLGGTGVQRTFCPQPDSKGKAIAAQQRHKPMARRGDPQAA